MKEVTGEVIEGDIVSLETSAMRPMAAANGVTEKGSNSNNEKVEIMEKKSSSGPGQGPSSRTGSGVSSGNAVSAGSRNGLKRRSCADVQDTSKSTVSRPLMKRTKTLPCPGKRQRDIRTYFTNGKHESKDEGLPGKNEIKPTSKIDQEKPGCSKALLPGKNEVKPTSKIDQEKPGCSKALLRNICTPPPEEEESVSDGNDSDQSEEYEVEKIIDYWEDDKKGKQYLVRWKGWTEDDDTWEPIDNVKNCYKLLLNFYQFRVKEIEKAKENHKHDHALLKRTMKQLPLPADPRPIREQMQVFFDRKGAITEKEVEVTFKEVRKCSKLRWTDARIVRNLKDFKADKLDDDQTNSLRFQLVYVEANFRYESAQADLKTWENDLNKIANGRPKISVVNEVDFAGPPVRFEYVNCYVPGKGVVINDDGLVACNCKDGQCLDSKDCCPAMMGTPDDRIAYTKNKRLRVEQGTPIYECNKLCPCGPDCSNRVVQDGTINLTSMELSIFRTNYDCGWGVKTLKPIKKGTFVALYAGEVILNNEAEKRGKVYDRSGNTYLFDLDFDDPTNCLYSVDATKLGNISHFINHSCEPNLAVFNVWANCVNVNIPMLALFSTRLINANEELSFDYGSKRQGEDSASQENKKKNRNASQQLIHGRIKCRCGTPSCRKILF